ncbi:uncharacterized protein G2W53_033942 [Senna tora]|uniref:Uncharacterized protein n=1 Tax=Senna tora TaxID=362788 RepID=A0A834T0G5_9FABA|nr:uncharacterized protein G2W53_033942 [Senna tora]
MGPKITNQTQERSPIDPTPVPTL